MSRQDGRRGIGSHKHGVSGRVPTNKTNALRRAREENEKNEKKRKLLSQRKKLNPMAQSVQELMEEDKNGKDRTTKKYNRTRV